MTARAHGRRRSQSTASRIVLLSALAATAAFAPDLLEQAATTAAHLLAACAFVAGDLVAQVFLEPLIHGMQQSISHTAPESTAPPGTG